jgi:branched-chain amino acid transport system ATP-binding protein
MLEIKNLEVTYKGVILGIKDISLLAPSKRITAILGANGAGKTTTIRAITGLLNFNGGGVTNGGIFFEGNDITHWTPQSIAASGIMQAPEGRRVFTQLTTEENLLMGSSSNSLGNKERRMLIQKIYGYFPALKKLRNRKAGYLSGGEQQMLAIGRALMAKPKLLIVDELSLGLAPLVTIELAKKLSEINQHEGLTILLVEQNVRLALTFAHDGYIVENGKISVKGRCESLKNEDVVKSYMGG